VRALERRDQIFKTLGFRSAVESKSDLRLPARTALNFSK
jgi:hypothetical protein